MADSPTEGRSAVSADPPVISVILKVLNEATQIRSALEAIFAVRRLSYQLQVIVADCASDDDTVAIAKNFECEIVQLENPSERCCGIGAELGFRQAVGDFIAVIDADFVLDPDYFDRVLPLFYRQSNLAGILGFVDELNLRAFEFQIRDRQRRRKTVSSVMATGSVLRTAAIRTVQYLADRNLNAYEELDLTLRLVDRGWEMFSVSDRLGLHRGPDVSNWQLLRTRWRGRRFQGVGEFIRARIKRPLFRRAMEHFRPLVIIFPMWFATDLALVLTPFLGPTPLVAAAAGWLALLGAQCFRARSVKRGLWMFLSWQLMAAGLLTGFFRPRQDPTAPIATNVIQRGSILPVASREKSAR